MGNTPSKIHPSEHVQLSLGELHQRCQTENADTYEYIRQTYRIFSDSSNSHLTDRNVDRLIRHLMLQLGVIDYLSRICDADGCLKWRLLIEAGIRTQGPPQYFDLKEFMDAALQWFYYLETIRAADTQAFIERIKAAQAKEHDAYSDAVAAFEKNYRGQMEDYREAMVEQRNSFMQKQLAALHAREQVFNIKDFGSETVSSKHTGQPDDMSQFFEDIIVTSLQDMNHQKSAVYSASHVKEGKPTSIGSPIAFCRSYEQRKRNDIKRKASKQRVEAYRGEDLVGVSDSNLSYEATVDVTN